MHKLTRKEKINKRKGRLGFGWRKNLRNRKTSQHVFSEDRWIVEPPAGSNSKTMAFLTEEKAVYFAENIANNCGSNVNVYQQKLDSNGNWQNVD